MVELFEYRPAMPCRTEREYDKAWYLLVSASAVCIQHISSDLRCQVLIKQPYPDCTWVGKTYDSQIIMVLITLGVVFYFEINNGTKIKQLILYYFQIWMNR